MSLPLPHLEFEGAPFCTVVLRKAVLLVCVSGCEGSHWAEQQGVWTETKGLKTEGSAGKAKLYTSSKGLASLALYTAPSEGDWCLFNNSSSSASSKSPPPPNADALVLLSFFLTTSSSLYPPLQNPSVNWSLNIKQWKNRLSLGGPILSDCFMRQRSVLVVLYFTQFKIWMDTPCILCRSFQNLLSDWNNLLSIFWEKLKAYYKTSHKRQKKKKNLYPPKSPIKQEVLCAFS